MIEGKEGYGFLYCHNPRCSQKVGIYSNDGQKCHTCGVIVTPAYQFFRSRLIQSKNSHEPESRVSPPKDSKVRLKKAENTFFKKRHSEANEELVVIQEKGGSRIRSHGRNKKHGTSKSKNFD